VLYAAGHGREAALATAAGWLAVFAVDAALIFAWRSRPVVSLGLGNAAGMSVAGALLMLAVRRRVGRGAFAGLGRTAAAAVPAAAAAGAAGWFVGDAFGWTGFAQAVLIGPVCTVLAIAVFGAVVLPLDGDELRPLAARFVVRLRARNGRGGGAGGGPGGAGGGAQNSARGAGTGGGRGTARSARDAGVGDGRATENPSTVAATDAAAETEGGDGG
jgi:hypothetical protein